MRSLLLGLLLTATCAAQDMFLMRYNAASGPTDGNLQQDTAFTANNLSGNDTLSWSHYQPSDYTDRLLLVGLEGGDGFDNINLVEAVSGGTPTALTEIYNTYSGGTGSERLYVWYLKDPPTGSITIRLISGASDKYFSAISVSYSGVDQTTPFEGSPIYSWERDTQQYISFDVTATTSTGIVVGFGASASGSHYQAAGTGEYLIKSINQASTDRALWAVLQAGTGSSVNLDPDLDGSYDYVMIGTNIRQDP